MSDKTVFIRHKFEQGPKLWSKPKKEKWIFIHFNGEKGETLEEYSEEAQKSRGFRTAFKRLKELGETGGLVMAQYETSEFLIGHVEPGTRIEFWDVHENDSAAKPDYYKTLQVAGKWEGPFKYADYPLLMALRPPFVTIANMSEYSRNMIQHLWNSEPLQCIVDNMHPKMLEQMCAEWLRSPYAAKEHKIQYQILKTGKSLPVIDLYAKTKYGEKLFAQITHTTSPHSARNKAQKLKALSEDSSEENAALFFGREEIQAHVEKVGVKFIPVESVFDELKRDPNYKPMLEEMIGIK
ncbi:MAG: hypothetical protein GY792_32680 [Gammaproteobacteria bacterium]|nr:hypothetical protein [Gammaproteobacteria bacterium]